MTTMIKINKLMTLHQKMMMNVRRRAIVATLSSTSTTDVAGGGGSTSGINNDCRCFFFNSCSSPPPVMYPTLTSRVVNNNINVEKKRFSTAAAYASPSSDGDNNTVIPFVLADIGEGIKEVELLQWFVESGDHVQQFDKICEVQSDKATVEITSRYDGIIQNLEGRVGDMIQVGQPLLYISTASTANTRASTSTATSDTGNSNATNSANTNSTTASKAETLHSFDFQTDEQIHIPHVASQFHLPSDNDNGTRTIATNATTEIKNNEKFFASPAVRKLGKEHNLDLSTFIGTGPHGRVLKSDVLTYLHESGILKPSSSSLPPPEINEDASQMQQQQQQRMNNNKEQNESITLKGYNRLMVKTMTESLKIPHMVYSDEINVSKLVDIRKYMNDQLLVSKTNDEETVKVSMLAFAVKAISLSLAQYPIMNSQWDNISEYTATIYKDHNIGIAMDTSRGLIVPVVHEVQNKSLYEIQYQINKLKKDAMDNKIHESDISNATFSLSNIGSVGGGTYMSPLIVPPQVAIGAMGTIQYLPRFTNEFIQEHRQQKEPPHTTSMNNVEIAPIMNISWAADHRLVDGATLARFSNTWKQYMESPSLMLMHMK